MAQEGFRFFDPRIAEGITITGQYFIRSVEKAVNDYIIKLTKDKKDRVSAIDTDSVYLVLKDLVDKFIVHNMQDPSNIHKIVDALDKISTEKITPVINAACDDIAQYTNSLSQLMNFKREAISSRGVWTGKKKYALSVYDNEGVRYVEPKTKVMGLEIVRSSTPAPIRKMLKDAVKIVLEGSEKELQSKIDGWKKEFLKMSPEEVAFPRGVQNMDNYRDTANIYKKGCPIHVRAALLYNHYVNKNSLGEIYPEISDGEKIKFIYLKMPNNVRENVFGFIDKFPRELGIEKYVDYEEMWAKAFLAPLDSIISTIGWSHKEKNTLAGLFDD